MLCLRSTNRFTIIVLAVCFQAPHAMFSFRLFSFLPRRLRVSATQVHEAVIAAGKSTSGCTVHQVTEEVDAGPIVVQEEVEVTSDDTPESLKAKVGTLETPAEG